MKKLFNYFTLIKMFNRANVHLAWYRILEKIMEFVLNVAKHRNPLMAKIAVIDMSKEKILGNRNIVSLWAAVGDANPIKRIRHLRVQNTELKKLLKICHEKIEVSANENLLLNIKLVLDTFE